MTPTTDGTPKVSEKAQERGTKNAPKKGWIRWRGLIAFLVITLLVAVAWHFLADWMVKKAIETAGTKAVGAEVEVAKADLSLLPTGLTLEGIQVTNPNAPMTNAMEIARMGMDLEFAQLIRRRVVINLMQVEGVRFDTPRQTSGALPEKALRKDAEKKPLTSETLKKNLQKMGCGNFQLPSFEKPNWKALFAKERLQSIELAQKLEADIKAEEAYWNKTLKELPDEKKLRTYAKKLEGWKSKKTDWGAILGKADETLTVQKEIQADLKLIKAAQQRFEKSSQELEKRLRDLPKAPMADVRRLQAKYSLSADGMANLSRLLIGGQLCDHWQTAWQWYQRLKPYFQNFVAQEEPQEVKPQRGKGVYVRFAEKTPLPTFLVRQTKISIELPMGKLIGKIEDLNSDPPLLGRPTKVNVLGRDLVAAKFLSVSGLIDLITPGRPSSQGKLELSGYKLQAVALSKEKALPVTVETALADVTVDFRFKNALIDTEVDIDFSKVKLATGATSGDNVVQAALMGVLTDIHQFDLVASFQGQVGDYHMKVRSSLDRTLKDAVGSLVKKEAAKLSSQIEAKVRQEVTVPLARAKQQMEVLGPVVDELKKRLHLGTSLLNGSGLKIPWP